MASIIVNEESAKNIVWFALSMVTAAIMLASTLAISFDGASITDIVIFASITVVSVIASFYYGRKIG